MGEVELVKRDKKSKLFKKSLVYLPRPVALILFNISISSMISQ